MKPMTLDRHCFDFIDLKTLMRAMTRMPSVQTIMFDSALNFVHACFEHAKTHSISIDLGFN